MFYEALLIHKGNPTKRSPDWVIALQKLVRFAKFRAKISSNLANPARLWHALAPPLTVESPFLPQVGAIAVTRYRSRRQLRQIYPENFDHIHAFSRRRCHGHTCAKLLICGFT